MLIHKSILIGCGILAVGLSSLSCVSNKPTEVIDAHSSEHALDWAGAYEGALPCADCEGIRTIVLLKSDRSYHLYQKEMRGNSEPKITGGTFSWSADGRFVELKTDKKTLRLQVGEHQLFWLDQKGKRIQGDSTSRYVLRKYENDIREKYWKLKSLTGVPVKTVGNREAHFILKQGNRFIGNGGCNAINGNFELKSEHGIFFTEVASTEMACAVMETEQKFLRALQQAEGYLLLGDHLYLKREAETLAEFEAVYLR